MWYSGFDVEMNAPDLHRTILKRHIATVEAREPLHATLYALAVVGESFSFVPNETRAPAPEVHWQGVIGLRNQIIHAYFRIDYEIVAGVVEHRLEPLIRSLDRLIERARTDLQ